MILESFDIQNWCCIKKVCVSNLPPTGVIVLHGPNRTGKSSIVQALRSCLMDYSSTTTALKSCYPRGTAEKPVVSVTFRTGGTSYRIRKHFGSNKCDFASQTSTGDWKVETTTAAEAHSRTCRLAGGDDSKKGLNQLLWLTQAEFHLPDEKKFDPNVQAQLRSVLGVLQTPLDNHFIERVKKRWNEWYSGQRKPAKQHEIKVGCKLAANLKKLQADQVDLQETEAKFNEVEKLVRRTADLEAAKSDLQRQLGEQNVELEKLGEKRKESQERILARQRAESEHAAAVKEQGFAQLEQQQRVDAAKQSLDDQNAIQPARKAVELEEQLVKTKEATLLQQRRELRTQRDRRQELQQQAYQIADKLRTLDDAEKLDAVKQDLHRAEEIARDVAEIDRYLAENPAPDKEELVTLKANRQKAMRLQAERDAASMELALTTQEGAVPAQLAVDGGPAREVHISTTATTFAVRRNAVLEVPGWGRAELRRGAGQGDLDQIQEESDRCHREFANALAPLGIAGNDANALDQALGRDAEHRLKWSERNKLNKELKRLDPEGLEPLRTKVVELETKLKSAPGIDASEEHVLPTHRNGLQRIEADVKKLIATLDGEINTLEGNVATAEADLGQATNAATTAKEKLASVSASAKSSREQLERLRIAEQISKRVQDALDAVANAESLLRQTELSDIERTIDERITAVEQAVRALEQQIADNSKDYHRIEGRLLESEGLHARRSSLAARVDELTRVTDAESLERDAVDRLHALFEECREREMKGFVGPIHDRVLGWMRLLDIGDYGEMLFNDAFLPGKLISRDGTSEFSIDEESTGAQEQIGMLVRLALGSILATANDSAVAILDDPLTHCDTGRLTKMRLILRRAAEGDPKLSPPAGPLQIIILTCHPEWFRDERAVVIDLNDPAVMSRYAV